MKRKTKYQNITYLNMTKPELNSSELKRCGIRIINIGRCKIYLAYEYNKRYDKKPS